MFVLVEGLDAVEGVLIAEETEGLKGQFWGEEDIVGDNHPLGWDSRGVFCGCDEEVVVDGFGVAVGFGVVGVVC